MKRLSYAACLSALALCAATPFTPGYYMNLAQTQLGVPEKTGFLKQLLAAFPSSDQSRQAHDHLVALLAGSNRFEDALQEYQITHPEVSDANIVDFKLLDYQLTTGRFADVLREAK